MARRTRGTQEEELYSAAERRPKEYRRKRKHDPQIKPRKHLVAVPRVVSFKDYKGEGMIRVLKRANGTFFPEFALYVPLEKKTHPYHPSHDEMLKTAGFTEETQGKWVLRTNVFSIWAFVKKT